MLPLLRTTSLVALALTLSAVTGSAQRRATIPYDHIHLAVPDPDKAYDWYVTNLEGQVGENPGRIMFEPFTGRRPLPVLLMFLRVPDAKPSEGSVIDSIGFSVPDVAAKMKTLEAAGAKAVAPAAVVD